MSVFAQCDFFSVFVKTTFGVSIIFLIVVDMLLVGYDVPIVQVMYLDNGLREHNLLQAIARVNRPYDERKDYGLIVDYCGITKELQKALAIIEEDDIKGVLEPTEKEFEELRLRHLDVMSFFKDIPNREVDDAIIEKFEPVNIRDEFEYGFKMFSCVTHDNILYNKEEDKFFCLLDAPSKEAVVKHHEKHGFECHWVTEVKTTAT